MKKLMWMSVVAMAVGSVPAGAFGLGDLGGIAKSAVGSAKADAAGSSASAGDLDTFLATAKEADTLISSSTDTLFKTMVPQKEVAAHNAKVLEANNIADPAKRAELLQQLIAQQMARLSKVDWDKQARETPKLLSAEQKNDLGTAIYNFTLGTLKDKELVAQSKGLIGAVRANPLLLMRAGELTEVSASVSNQLAAASSIAGGLPKMASAVGLGALPSSAAATAKK